MNADQLAGIAQRANDVVNGFTTVRTQNARDTVKVLAYVAELEHAKEVLMKRLVESRGAQPGKGNLGKSFDELFESIFGKDFFKNPNLKDIIK